MKKIILLLFVSSLCFGCSKQSATATANTNSISKRGETGEQQTALTTLQFSGYTWYIKNSGSSTQGPGPNYWNKANAFVDANGWLHLKLKKSGGKWVCAEIWSQQSFGNGSYQFQVEGAIDKFDKNVVLGLFNYSGNDGFDEMDIEFARWGNRNYPNLNYTIWPAQAGYNNFSYTQEFALTGTYSTHRFTRTNNNVTLKSMHGFTNDDTNLFASAACINPPNSVSQLAMPVHLNLWLFQGSAPSNNKPVEIIIHSFTYAL